MSKNPIEFTTPPGRFVFGDLYEPNDKDFDGNPLVIKSGTDKGKPRVEFIIGLAVPKTQAGHWANEPGWGQTIWAAGHAAFPGGEAQSPGFSWKILDGDQKTVSPKSKSKVPYCDREGHKGCWILRFSGGLAPKIHSALNLNNVSPLLEPNAVIPGYVMQVIGTVDSNTGSSPGVYLNHKAVGLRAYLPAIITQGVDVTGKFGGSLPAGASMMPAAGYTAPAAPGAPAAPAAGSPPPPPPAAFASAPPPAPTAVQPSQGFIAPPAPGAAPPPPSAPAAPAPPPAGPQMTAAANRLSYAQYIAAGWTDAQLRAKGMMV
jgi:hypothetical protein